MGWSYRKSVNLGPFRLNISKAGIGYSVGGKGFRTGVTSSVADVSLNERSRDGFKILFRRQAFLQRLHVRSSRSRR